MPCSSSDPIWVPDSYQSESGAAMIWRDVMPLPATPHPNDGSLNVGSGRVIVGSPSYFLLPRVAGLYGKPEKLHKEHCARRYCAVPDALRAMSPRDVAYPSAKKRVRSAPP